MTPVPRVAPLRNLPTRPRELLNKAHVAVLRCLGTVPTGPGRC